MWLEVNNDSWFMVTDLAIIKKNEKYHVEANTKHLAYTITRPFQNKLTAIRNAREIIRKDGIIKPWKEE